jgi:alpha-L-fucosidase
MLNFHRLLLVLFIVSFIEAYPSQTCNAQNENLSWEALRDQYKVPKWFTEARFGIWVHWGAQTVPELGGGGHARHMYMEDVGRHGKRR